MAIRKQNRTIWVLAAVILLMLVVFLIRDGQIAQMLQTNSQSQSTDPTSSVEQFGDRVGGNQTQDRQNFFQSLDLLAACFQVSGSALPENAAIGIDSLLQKFQADFGSVSQQSDRWVYWGLRTREGNERRLRLELTETDSGKIVKELHYFSVDQNGQQVAIELDPQKTKDPNDEVISQLLKDGEVFTKERAAVAFFQDLDRVEYIEKDGELLEIKFFNDNHQFQCANVKNPKSCQCQ
ncbi:MAG: hypothetical protein ACAH59_06945 [Pseudobdellovibrionaceae bacterium]